jgi:hypothetical protein
MCGRDHEPLVTELFEGSVLKSFEAADGWKRIDQVRALMRTDDNGDTRIYPFEDEKFLRVVRKIIRALCWTYDLGWPIADERVSADRLQYHIPPGFLDGLEFGQTPGGLCKWWLFLEPDFAPGASAWILVLRHNVKIVARVEPQLA